jgi:hypothetical protein
MLKEFMTTEEIEQCKLAARMMRLSGFGVSGREVEGLDAKKVRAIVEGATDAATAIAECGNRAARLCDYGHLLARVKNSLPEAYPHLVEAMKMGDYLPGETFPKEKTAPCCVVVYDPERTFALIRSVNDGTLERLMRTMRETGGRCEPGDEACRRLLAAFPSLRPSDQVRTLDYLPLYLDWGFEHDVFDRMADIRGFVKKHGARLISGTSRHHFSWKGLIEAKTSGFADLEHAAVWSSYGGIPEGPFLDRLMYDGGTDLIEGLRELGGDRIAVFTFRLPIMNNGFALCPEAVLLHSVEEHGRWEGREPMFASENVAHGIGAVLTHWGRMEKTAYLRGKYVKPAENGFRLVFGSKWC